MITKDIDKNVFVVSCRECGTVCLMNELPLENKIVRAWCPYCGKEQMQTLNALSPNFGCGVN